MPQTYFVPNLTSTYFIRNLTSTNVLKNQVKILKLVKVFFKILFFSLKLIKN